MTAVQVNAITTYIVGRLEVKTAGDLVMAGELNINSIALFRSGQSIDMSASTRPFSDFGPIVIGGAGADVIIGSVRRDGFSGQDGVDELHGWAANDALTGGAGADLMYGGADQDRFAFSFTTDTAAGAANRDVIFDLQVAPGGTASFIDRLSLAFIDASVSGVGDQAFALIRTQGFTAEGQLRATRMNPTHTLIAMNAAGTGGAEMQIVLKNFMATDISASDYLA